MAQKTREQLKADHETNLPSSGNSEISAADLRAALGNIVDSARFADDLSGYAPVGHDHAGVYAPIGHGHAGVYSPVGHDHAGVYSPVGHDHAGTYAAVNHTHDVSQVTGAISSVDAGSSAIVITKILGATAANRAQVVSDNPDAVVLTLEEVQ